MNTKKRKIITIDIFFLFAFVIITNLASCVYDPELNYGELRSDGYITYSYLGNNIFIPDSIKGGDPAVSQLDGYYYSSDSSLTLYGSQFPIYGRINFHLIHCMDTGVFNLGSITGSYASLNGWNTDSFHVGIIHITNFDTTKGRIAGTFQFQGVNKKLSPDSIFVDSGLLYNFPIGVLH
jgi:hypothetical protein